MAPEHRLSIAQVTSHPWGTRNEINEFSTRVASELAKRGHRVLIAAPSDSRKQVRESRRAIGVAPEKPEALFDDWDGVRISEDGPAVVALGSGIPRPRGPGARAAPLPLDVSRSLEGLFVGVDFDVVHVHDPFFPSVASAALRHSRALNVGSFHEPTERILSTQVARPLVEIFLGRLDARTTSCGTTAELMERFFPGAYERVTPGADAVERPYWPTEKTHGESKRPLRIVFCLSEERGALRLFLRAVRRLSLDAAWEVAIWVPDSTEIRIAQKLRDRVRIVGARESTAEALVAGADAVCACSGGPQLAPGIVRTALANETIPVVSQNALYAELIADGELGLMFPLGDAVTLAGQLERLVETPTLRRELLRRAGGAQRDWQSAADQVEEIYGRIAARRHDPAGSPELRRRISRRREINVDLHMHTDHSSDCATPVETLLATAAEAGLGAIAITDHNEISGALAAREAAEPYGVKVIIAEEVKTAEQGEVIGLFLEQLIPRGMSMEETIAEIRRQGGLVYVPHPFDRLHSVPDYEHLLGIVEEIDIIEVFNPRVALTAFNEEAERFAEKYRIVPGAGSDSHVAQGLGSVMTRVHDFDGPQEFLEAMRSADIVRKHKNLVYVQTLKWLQTGGGRGGKRVSGARRPPARSSKA